MNHALMLLYSSKSYFSIVWLWSADQVTAVLLRRAIKPEAKSKKLESQFYMLVLCSCADKRLITSIHSLQFAKRDKSRTFFCLKNNKQTYQNSSLTYLYLLSPLKNIGRRNTHVFEHIETGSISTLAYDVFSALIDLKRFAYLVLAAFQHFELQIPMYIAIRRV